MASEIIKFSIPLAGLKRAESDRKNSQEKLFNGKNRLNKVLNILCIL